jgi:divalent metal cation (Fe/Co/Zn/Cd) transporter
MTSTPNHDSAETQHLRRLGLRLEWATIWWNLAEAGITVWLGLAAGSLALAGFGIDSLIEVFASSVVVWHVRDIGELGAHARNRTAIRLIGLAFLALGAFLVVAAIVRLNARAVPDESWLGVAYLALAATVMFGLAVAKRRVGVQLGNAPLVAEARITLLDGALASAVLVALLLNTALGWWWADSVAAAVVGLVALREGWEHFEETRGDGDDRHHEERHR